jgi:hypothetical protein
MNWEKIKEILLDHRLFIAIVGLIFVISLGLLILFTIFPQKNPSINEIMEVKHDRPTVTFPLDLYVEPKLSSKYWIIKKIALDWNKATDGKIDVNPKFWDPPRPFSVDEYTNYKFYTIWLLDDGPELTNLQLKYSIIMNGTCIGKFIVIVNDMELNDDLLYISVKHEMGHLVGMEHIKAQYPALMNLGANRGNITKFDMIQVDYLYP